MNLNSEQVETIRHASVCGQIINVPSQAKAVESIIAAAQSGDAFSCFTLNLDHLVKLRRNSVFQRAYRAARFVTADGAPVAALARHQWREVERTTGADLFIPICEAAAKRGLPIYLFGTDESVLVGTAREMKQRTSGRVIVAGLEAPPQGFDPTGREADETIERIRCSNARICFVMLGAPKQEIFATRALERGIQCGFICVGAAADFLVGRQKRAPLLLQRWGLEWVWRLANSPLQLGPRYLRCGGLLVQLLTQEAWCALWGAPANRMRKAR